MDKSSRVRKFGDEIVGKRIPAARKRVSKTKAVPAAGKTLAETASHGEMRLLTNATTVDERNGGERNKRSGWEQEGVPNKLVSSRRVLHGRDRPVGVCAYPSVGSLMSFIGRSGTIHPTI